MSCQLVNNIIEAMAKDEQTAKATTDAIMMISKARSRSAVLQDVYRKRRKLATFGTTEHLQRAQLIRVGRHRVLGRDAESLLIQLIVKRPDLWLDELQYEVFVEFDLWVSTSTISRILKRKDFSLKVMQTVAGQRDPLLRANYLRDLASYEPWQLVYVDESAASEKSLDRRYGRAPKGRPARSAKALRRSKRWSVLPAYTIDGWLETMVHHGSITSEVYNDWLENKVMRHCEAYPGKNSVLVMDNASIHRSQALRDLCHSKGIILQFLPPYSPDYNPIEVSFHLFKQYLRRHAYAAPAEGPTEAYEEQFELFLETCAQAWGRAVDHRALFRRCHVNFEDKEAAEIRDLEELNESIYLHGLQEADL